MGTKIDNAKDYVNEMSFWSMIRTASIGGPRFSRSALMEAYMEGWDKALQSLLVDASKKLPKYEVDVWVINADGDQFFCHRTDNKKVLVDKDKWCNYTGSDIIAWIRPKSIKEMIELNKDILKRLKNK